MMVRVDGWPQGETINGLWEVTVVVDDLLTVMCAQGVLVVGERSGPGGGRATMIGRMAIVVRCAASMGDLVG